jgi:hypothetical protein
MPGPIKAQIPTARSAPLYQLEYHMKITMKSPLVRPSAAVAVAAVLAFWFTLGGPQVVRAEDPETLSPPGQDMILVPVKTVNALEQRVKYLEESVAALTEAWQHIETHRLCVSDDGGAETCVTKAQLDLVLSQLPKAEISQPAVSQEAKASPAAEPVDIAATTEAAPAPEPTTVVGENVLPDQEPEVTGTVKSASTDAAAVLSYPKVEPYEEPAARSDN